MLELNLNLLSLRLTAHDDLVVLTRKLEDELKIQEEHEGGESLSNAGSQVERLDIRTATGGIIHRFLVFLTFLAFIGNGFFMIYVFWLSK